MNEFSDWLNFILVFILSVVLQFSVLFVVRRLVHWLADKRQKRQLRELDIAYERNRELWISFIRSIEEQINKKNEKKFEKVNWKEEGF